jgi:large repetitive protein
VDLGFIAGIKKPSGIAVDALPKPTPDTAPPDTTITKGARNKTDKTEVKFKFSSSESDSTFECGLASRKVKPCTSPKTIRNLDQGKHKFKVRAIDAAGNVDPSAAKDKFKVVG